MEETPKSGYLTQKVGKRSSGYYFVKLYADAPWRPLYWDANTQTFDALGQKLGSHQVAVIHSEKIKMPN